LNERVIADKLDRFLQAGLELLWELIVEGCVLGWARKLIVIEIHWLPVVRHYMRLIHLIRVAHNLR